ncbi:MAG: trypsin-like peptidase domain-containing protein [Verrucomicrobiales bacterium]|nr:trypsin-like peptidase domain-containing protein [Verrucomicrobiales bacterium]
MMARFVSNFLITVVVLLTAVFLYRVVSNTPGQYTIYDLVKGTKLTATSPALGQSGFYQGPVVDPNDLEVLTKVNRALADITEAVVPSVVSIDTKKTVNVRRVVPTGPFGMFGYYQNQPTERSAGLGSGAIVSEEGHIVTNHHVVATADQIQVTLNDGSIFEAELIGSDPIVDVAILKIVQPEGVAPLKFNPLPFGDSDQVRVGEMALAIGNPFGLSETVTRGIISAKQRQLTDSANEYFQVDAVINPGNSGGPLVNIRGELIGVNVAIFTGQQNVKVWQGIGLSIPSNEAREIYEAIANDRPLERGYLGVGLDNVPMQYMQAYRMKTPGALVLEVTPNSPAESAGMQRGDIVIGFDKKAITSPQDFIGRIRRKKSGETADLKILRQGEEITLTPEFVAKADKNTFQIRKVSGQNITESLGIQVQDINRQQRDALGVPANFPAIMISDVKSGSQAESRFKAGDLIHMINRDAVTDVDVFYNLLESLPRDNRSIMILSRNGERFAAVLNP